MKNRMLTLALLTCLILSLGAPAAAADLNGSALQTVRALGIMSGDFSGNLNSCVTRAEFASMLTAASRYRDTIGSEGSGYSLFKDVKSSHWASEYIRLAIEQGWMTGYTDGTFRPEQTVTLEEACAAVLKLLGYDSSSLAGSFPQAQLTKAGALGLRDQVSAARGQALTRRDCVYLFYNLLTVQTSGGQPYAASLGYTVTNGEVDYTAATLENVSGPYVAETGSVSLPFTPSTVYRDGELVNSAAISRYDVYYYNAGLSTLWIYTDRISGKISALSPSATSPTSVTVSGVTCPIGSSAATYKLSALGGGAAGNIVTLLLGMDGSVVDVLTGDETDMTYYGVVQTSSRSASSDGSAAVQTSVSVICSDGAARTFTVDKDTVYSAGKLVSVSVSGGGIVLKTLSDRTASGKVNQDATKLGDRTLAGDVEILDSSKEGGAVAVEPERLANQTLSSSDVRYYALNENGEISHLILNDATGDIWSYGYMISASENEQAGSLNFSSAYRYIMDGKETSLNVSNISYAVQSGGFAVRYNADGSVKSMKNTEAVKLTDIGLTTVKADHKTYALADGAQVYLKQDGNYYLTDLSSINAEDYSLTGYYDSFGCPAGGQIRVIVAAAK